MPATLCCWVPSRLLTQKEVEELNIRLNKNGGEFDFDMLANEWNIDDLAQWGFSHEELGIDSGDILDESGKDNESLEPGNDEDALIKPGDLIEMNNHRLICGDSTDKDLVKILLNQAKPVLMVTDPPYGVEYDPSWRKDIKDKHGAGARAMGKVQNDDKIDWTKAWENCSADVAYVWHAGRFTSQLQSDLEKVGFEMVAQIIWAKQHFALSRGDYHWQHEPCWYAVRKGIKHNWQGARDQSTLWEISNLNAFGTSVEEDERTAHSTQKPLECMSRPMRNNTQEGDLVYDPFLGSGTTLIAAQKLNRVCYGVELSPAYCDIILKRWVKFMQENGFEYTIKVNGEELEL